MAQLKVGDKAPAFSLEDQQGKTVKLADFKGKVIVLDFWYRGCGWCIMAMPQIKEVVVPPGSTLTVRHRCRSRSCTAISRART